MQKINVSHFISLDGVVEAPETWHFPFVTPDMDAHNVSQLLESDSFLYGRITYEAFGSFWPNMTNNEYGIADKLNTAPKYVVSSTLKEAQWQNSTLFHDIEAVRNLKQQGTGTIGMTGSMTLIRSLMQANLIDQIDLLVHPIVLGTGKRLFTDGFSQTQLKLVETKKFDGGVILLRYHLAN